MKRKRFLLMIIVIIIIIVILFSIKNSQKEDTIVNELDEKTIIDMKNNITEVNIVTNINNLTNPKIEEIAKNTLNEYIEKISHYEKSSIGPMPYLLSNLGFTSVEELNEMCTDVYSSTDYIKSNVKYSDFKNALLQYITEDYFLKYFSQYKNIDGYVAFCNCAGASGTSSVEKVKLISRIGNTFNFKITIKDLEMYEHYKNDQENIKEKDCFFDIEVALEYVDNRLVISKYSQEVILEGLYFLDNTDASYEFYKDGTVEYSINSSVLKGNYVSNGTNELIIVWEEEITWDIITAEEIVSEIEGSEVVTVINNTKIRVESEHDGEKIVNEFIKK